MKLLGIVFLCIALHLTDSKTVLPIRYSNEMDASSLEELLGYLRANNFQRNARIDPESDNDGNPYQRKTFGLRHFKNRKPFLSFRDRRSNEDEEKRDEKRKETNLDNYNRWLLYTQYYNNAYQ